MDASRLANYSAVPQWCSSQAEHTLWAPSYLLSGRRLRFCFHAVEPMDPYHLQRHALCAWYWLRYEFDRRSPTSRNRLMSVIVLLEPALA